MVNSQLVTKNLPYLTHPIVITALVLTAVNDHYLKYAYPGLVTGKISDFSGLFYFPLFLHALYEVIQSPRSWHLEIKKRQLFMFIGFTDLVFIICKYTPVREFLIEYFHMQIALDYTDLVALSVNVLTYLFARKFFITEVATK